MIFLHFIFVSKNKKVILPGLLIQDLKPVCSLLKPSDVVVPFFLVSVLAQLSDNLKNVLEVKDIQSLPSVKIYRKILFSGINSISLSVIYAISKTLGPELESLSVLKVSERFTFLKDLQSKIINDKSPGRIDFRQRIVNNPVHLMKHRKGLAIQLRSFMIASSIFSPNSIVFGTPISFIDLDLILASSKLLWFSLGLSEEEFDFLFKKDAINKLRLVRVEQDFCSCNTMIDCLRTILYFEFLKFLPLEHQFNVINFSSDNVIVNGEKNLVLLEKELGFIIRSIPDLPSEVFVSEDKLDDVLLRTALEQRREYKLSFDNIYTNLPLTNVSKKNSNLLKNIKFKRFLHDN